MWHDPERAAFIPATPGYPFWKEAAWAAVFLAAAVLIILWL